MPSPNPQLPAAKKVVVEEVKPVQPTTRAAKLAAFRTQITDAVLKQRTVWLLAASYFFVYVVRQALTSWSVFYLMQAKGVASLAEAGVRVSGLEVGGLIGSISSGWLSDVLIKKQPQAGAIGQRVKVILLYLALTAAAASAFFLIPVTKGLLWLQWLMFAFTGMGLYGPQLLVGLCGAEAVDERYAATSNGFVGLTAYVGATLAGFPLSVAVRKLGWGALWGIVVGCCGIVAALLLPLIRKKSFSQSVAEAEAKSA